MLATALLVDFGGVLTDLGDEPAPDAHGGDRAPAGEPPLVRAVRLARRAGIRTAIVSNTDTSTALAWTEVFDRVVVSGEVGLAKPDPDFYRLVSRLLGVEPGRCIVVDDLRRNVDGAVEAGMIGVHHGDVRSTLDEVRALLDCGHDAFMIR